VQSCAEIPHLVLSKLTHLDTGNRSVLLLYVILVCCICVDVLQTDLDSGIYSAVLGCANTRIEGTTEHKR